MANPSNGLSGAAEAKAIADAAKKYGVDPFASLAVASVESGFGGTKAVGDSGTSFGPFQLHAGGALPSDVWAKGAAYANEWANSPEGIDYAVRTQAGAAHGLSGAAAVHAIVYLFERPKDPASEYSTAMQHYQQLRDSGGSFLGNLWGDLKGYESGMFHKGINAIPNPPGTDIVTGAVDAGKGVVNATVDTAHFLGKLTNPVLWERALYVVAGGFLMGMGLVIVAREIGAPVVRTPVDAAMKLAKAGG